MTSRVIWGHSVAESDSEIKVLGQIEVMKIEIFENFAFFENFQNHHFIEFRNNSSIASTCFESDS